MDGSVTHSVTHSVLEWLQILTLGGLIGALGQAARTIVGLKKTSDTANSLAASASDSFGAAPDRRDAANGAYHTVTFSDLIVMRRLVVSLIIGFVVGALAAIAYIAGDLNVSGQAVFAVAAAGYAGADFIEGFMLRQDDAPVASAVQKTEPQAGGVTPQSDGSVG